MNILLAVCTMTSRTGAEWFVYDLALALKARGHSVIVYAPLMNDMVDPLRFRCVPCVTDLQQIATTPDIIIGNTFAETILCLAHFPETPVISICHDRSAHHGRPPFFSRIRQHIAVDANCAERFTLENGIPESKIKIIQNGVDLARFKPRGLLPKRPKRAVIFSNYATENQETQVIRTVCSSLGIELTVMGSGTNNQVYAPEQILPDFDLVFAKARCAMEAMVVGCAVILQNEGMGIAGMVTRANVVDWHAWNFGRKLLQHPIDALHVQQAIEAYSSEDATQVSTYMREHASLDITVTAFEHLAQCVVASESSAIPIDVAQENREFARYLYELNQALTQKDRLLEQQEQSLKQQEKIAFEKQQDLQFRDNSNSWRLTAPIREIRRRLTKWLNIA